MQLPRDYSGNAFSPPVMEDILPKAPPGTPPKTQQEPPTVSQAAQDAPAPPKEAAAQSAFAPSLQGGGGIFSKLPFLSVLLPPPRQKDGKRCEKEGGFLQNVELLDWVLIGAALLLFFTDNTDDILPLLLLLLLWD